MSEIEKFHYHNEMMVEDIKHIIANVEASGWKPDYVVGIARGGLVPATYISHATGLPLLTFRYSLRDHAIKDRFDYIAQKIAEGSNLLFIDDICDEGHTFAQIWNVLIEKSGGHTENVRSAVLIHNAGQTVFTPDFVSTVIDKSEKNVWVVFPWETLEKRPTDD